MTETAATNVAKEQLTQFVTQIESLESEKADLQQHIKDIYGEAKATGYDTKVLRMVIAARKRAREEFEEEKQLVELYLDALGSR